MSVGQVLLGGYGDPGAYPTAAEAVPFAPVPRFPCLCGQARPEGVVLMGERVHNMEGKTGGAVFAVSTLAIGKAEAHMADS